MIRMNDFKRETTEKRAQLVEAFNKFLDTGHYILGPESTAFEAEFAAFVGTKYAIGVANGLEALQIALLALNIGPGDEVITVANTAIATALSIKQVGAEPVLVDIDKYYHLDPAAVERAITKRTKAIMPVHLFGQIVNWTEIANIAKKHNIPIVEDACQAHGATFRGKQAGSLGIMGCFSFYPTKNLGAYGDGGAITTNSKELYQQAMMLRNYGQSKRYYHDVIGINSRLDDLQAVFLRQKLSTLPAQLKQRQMLAAVYDRELAGIPQLRTPQVRPGSGHSYHLYVIEAERRDELQKFLADREIESLIHYPIPIHQQKAWQPCSTQLPVTERMAGRVLSLPINPYLTKTEAKQVCAVIKDFYKTTTPTVAIGIPAHNEEKNITRLLDSISQQKQTTFKLSSITVFCDGCTDKTAEIVARAQGKNPLLKLVNDGRRVGQAARLNQLYAKSTSDITIALDADIVLTALDSLEKLVEPFQDPTVGLVGGNNLPLPPRTLFEKVVTSYELTWRMITKLVNDGHNVHNHPGCMSAARQQFVSSMTIPAEAVANDHWLYFAMIKAGHAFRFAPGAVSAFRVPGTLRDYLLQTARFLHSNRNVTNSFSQLSQVEYAIPAQTKIQVYLRQFVKNPLLLIAALSLQVLQRLSMPFLSQQGKGTIWTMIQTSKE